MDAKAPSTELLERLRQQHEAIEERLARTATRIGSVVDRLAAALALDMDAEAEDGPDASRAALAESEPATSDAMPASEAAVPVVLELRHETSQPAVSMAGAGNDV